MKTMALVLVVWWNIGLYTVYQYREISMKNIKELTVESTNIFYWLEKIAGFLFFPKSVLVEKWLV